MKDRLPDTWAVIYDGSEESKAVLKYLNDKYDADYWGSEIGGYYGVSNDEAYCVSIHRATYIEDVNKLFSVILTLDEFIELTTESPNWKELYADT
jgi:hypothetical protein